MKYKIKNISESVLKAYGAKALVGKSAIDLPTDAYKASRDALLSSGVAVQVLKSNPWSDTVSFGDSKQFRWAPQYVGLKQDQLNAVFVLGVVESVGQLAAGITQKAINGLVKALPALPVDAEGNVVSQLAIPKAETTAAAGDMALWLVGGGLAAVAAFVFMRKRKRGRR